MGGNTTMPLPPQQVDFVAYSVPPIKLMAMNSG
jgi:hypothetical protein